MGISVANVLRLPALKEATLVAGEEGLMRTVECIGLLEGRDSVQWLERGSLIVNNSRVFENFTPGEWEGMIDTFSQRQAAGIALKVGRFVKRVPAEAIERANALRFPVIVLPPGASAAQIINDVCYALFRAKPWGEGSSKADSLLKDIALGREDRALLRESLAELGWKSRKKYGVAAFQDRQRGARPRKRDNVVASIPDWSGAFREACEGAGFPYVFPVGGFAYAVTVLDGEPDPEACLLARASSARDQLQRTLPQSFWHAGAGKIHDSLMTLSDACMEARATLAASLAQADPMPIISYDDLGFLGILLDVRNRELLTRTIDRAFDSLKAYDVEHDAECERTLRVHAREGMSVRKTAAAMFLHENTVRYRLTVINGLLSSGVFKGGRRINTDLLCYLYRWQIVTHSSGDCYPASYLEE